MDVKVGLQWCFWTVVLEKTPESLGLQGDTKSPSSRKSVLNIHWKDWCWSWNSNTLMRRTDSFEKTLMLGKIEGRRRRGQQRMRWLHGITDSMDMSLSKIQGFVMVGRPGVLQSMWSHRVRNDWVTELTDWLRSTNWSNYLITYNYFSCFSLCYSMQDLSVQTRDQSCTLCCEGVVS